MKSYPRIRYCLKCQEAETKENPCTFWRYAGTLFADTILFMCLRCQKEEYKDEDSAQP